MTRRAFLSPPHRITHPEKVTALAADMALNGWVGEPLIGYWDDDLETVQLLTGTHRFHAAARLGLHIPLVIRDKRDVSGAWGDLDRWARLLDPTL